MRMIWKNSRRCTGQEIYAHALLVICVFIDLKEFTVENAQIIFIACHFKIMRKGAAK